MRRCGCPGAVFSQAQQPAVKAAKKSQKLKVKMGV
jgi:hypothetical protein